MKDDNHKAMADLLQTILFYTFSGFVLLSAVRVISAKNPVHSVLFLILAFFNSAGLFLLIGAEYLAMTLIIVYVGAVAVLFLFVVMMLDINFTELREGFLRYLPLGATVAGVILFELLIVFYVALMSGSPGVAPEMVMEGLSQATNTRALGAVLYTQFVYPFQVSGLILLVAMVGAIVLTLRTRPGVRRQNVGAQLARKREDAVSLIKVKSGEGV